MGYILLIAAFKDNSNIHDLSKEYKRVCSGATTRRKQVGLKALLYT